MHTSLANIIALLIRYKFGMVFAAAVIEGPTIGVICGFLLRLGYFDFWPLYLVLIGSDLVGDAIWYAVGYFGARRLIARFGHFVSLDAEVVGKIETKFRRHLNKTLLISKMTSGFGFAILTLITAGTIRVPLKNYFFMNFIGGFVWSAILISAGYFFGGLYTKIDAGFRIASLVVFIVIVIALLYGFQKYLRSRLNAES
jgi:membrane protein DedA with SNARE-associated domain